MVATNKNRVFSFLLDAFIVGIMTSLIESLFTFISDKHSFELFGINFNYSLSLSLLIYLIYFIVFDLFLDGKSIGKLIWKIKIVSKENSMDFTISSHIRRTMLKLVSILILPISILMFLLNQGFTLHDYYTNATTIQQS